MRLCPIGSVFLALLLSGCVQTRTVSDKPADRREAGSYAEANQVLKGATAIVTTRGGDRFRAQNVVVRPDSISWTSMSSGQSAPRMATCEVREISRFSRAQGALSGAVVGVLAVGTAIVVGGLFNGELGNSYYGSGFDVALAVIGGGVPGALAGYALGGESPRFLIRSSECGG